MAAATSPQLPTSQQQAIDISQQLAIVLATMKVDADFGMVPSYRQERLDEAIASAHRLTTAITLLTVAEAATASQPPRSRSRNRVAERAEADHGIEALAEARRLWLITQRRLPAEAERSCERAEADHGIEALAEVRRLRLIAHRRLRAEAERSCDGAVAEPRS